MQQPGDVQRAAKAWVGDDANETPNASQTRAAWMISSAACVAGGHAQRSLTHFRRWVKSEKKGQVSSAKRQNQLNLICRFLHTHLLKRLTVVLGFKHFLPQ
jgi:hypothetical protein